MRSTCGAARCSVQDLNLLRNPVYIGKVRFLNTVEPPELVDGVHEAIVPESLFNQVQEVPFEKQRRIISRNTRDELLLRGILKCSNGSRMTGSRSKGS